MQNSKVIYRGLIVFIFIFPLVSCSEKKKEEEPTISKALEVSKSIYETLESMDDNISAGTESIQKIGEEAFDDLNILKKGINTFSFSESEAPEFSEGMKALKAFISENKYELLEFQQLVGKFPYLEGYESLVYDSYTIKQEGRTKAIIWHLKGFENIEEVNDFNATLFEMNMRKDPDFESHYKRFKFWAVCKPKDVLLIQASPDLKEKDPELFGILYHQLLVRDYIRS